MDHDDRVEQALDDFWKKMGRWRGWVSASTNEEAALAIAYDAWKDLTDPPGDPHKEWVDARSQTPPDKDILLVEVAGYVQPALARYIDDQWDVQQYRNAWFRTKTQITHWRYIPGLEDDNE
jgi:hypothetical protein